MPFGDYGHYQRFHTSRNADVDLLAANAGPVNLVVARSAGHQTFIQKISVSINTYAAATMTFQDTAGTPVKFGLESIPAAAEAHVSESGSFVIDFGPQGKPITIGKDLQLVLSGAGIGASIHVEAYEKIGTTTGLAIATTN